MNRKSMRLLRKLDKRLRQTLSEKDRRLMRLRASIR